MSTMILDGKGALVTGGARRIGASIRERFSGDGVAVAFTYIQSHDRARTLVDSINTGEVVHWRFPAMSQNRRMSQRRCGKLWTHSAGSIF